MSSLEDVLEAFRKFPNTTAQGSAVEDLMVRYLELGQMYAQQYDQVWRWQDWPGRQGRTDTGIDLAANERETGEFTAIQCKFYDPGSYLSKEAERYMLGSRAALGGSPTATESRLTKPQESPTTRTTGPTNTTPPLHRGPHRQNHDGRGRNYADHR